MQPTAQIWILATNRSEAARNTADTAEIERADGLSEAARDRETVIRAT